MFFQELKQPHSAHLGGHGLDHSWQSLNHLPVEGVGDSNEIFVEAEMKSVGHFIQHQHAEINGTLAWQVRHHDYRNEFHSFSQAIPPVRRKDQVLDRKS